MNREELDRKMDHKRLQIHSGVQEIRQLEQKVNQLRDEKVGYSCKKILHTCTIRDGQKGGQISEKGKFRLVR